MRLKRGPDAEKATDWLLGFTQLGINDFSDSGDHKNFRATCPWTDKSGKLYVDKTTGLWDSKTHGIGGNFTKFMQEFYKTCSELTDKTQLAELAEHRGLPIEAFDDVALNQLNGEWMIPTRNHKGDIVGLGRYNGKAVYRTSGTKVYLNYCHEITEGSTIYVTEGEWDTIALRWLLREAEIDGAVVVTVPGAGTFKDEWLGYFDAKDVVLCYDFDAPGRAGEEKAHKKLFGRAKSIKFVHWGKQGFKDGYDIRDWILEHGGKRQGGREAKALYEKFCKMVKNESNWQLFKPEDNELPKHGGYVPIPKGSEDGDKPKQLKGLDIPIPTWQEVYKKFDENLKMTSFIPVDIIMGTMFANRIEGDPIWTLLVAPPGGSKTEFLMTLNGSEWVETTTSLTPASLISGIKFEDGNDPSLLIKVNQRMLVIKDFTTIMSSQSNVRDEIFGILRDAYDGYVEKFFGTGVKKSYHSKFGILAGVTPAIDSLSAQHSSLGERFLKFRMARFETEESEREKIERAMQGIGSEGKRRDELQSYVASHLRREVPKDAKLLPQINQEMTKKFVSLAMFTASLRGSITKDPYSGEMLCLPVVEVGTRLAKQLSKLAIGIAFFKNLKEVDEEIFDTMRMVSIDTCPDRIKEVVEVVYRLIRDKHEKDAWCKTKELVDKTHISSTTFQRLSENLCLLGIMKKHSSGLGNETRWTLTPRILELISHAGLFQD